MGPPFVCHKNPISDGWNFPSFLLRIPSRMEKPFFVLPKYPISNQSKLNFYVWRIPSRIVGIFVRVSEGANLEWKETFIRISDPISNGPNLFSLFLFDLISNGRNLPSYVWSHLKFRSYLRKSLSRIDVTLIPLSERSHFEWTEPSFVSLKFPISIGPNLRSYVGSITYQLDWTFVRMSEVLHL